MTAPLQFQGGVIMETGKNEWIKQRFGEISDETLGWIKNIPDIVWPYDITETYLAKEGLGTLTYCLIKNIEKYAERIAEIYQNGIDEMIGNEEYEWHHNPKEIVQKVKTGDWAFCGCFWEGTLISAVSMHIIRGQRAVQWVWGSVDPVYRGSGVWKFSGKFLDRVVRESNAQMGLVWVVTTHKLSQRTVESAGYRPIGCFIGGEFFGGSDGRYYRATVIYYAKFYKDAAARIQRWEDMEMTEQASALVNVVKTFWEEELK